MSMKNMTRITYLIIFQSASGTDIRPFAATTLGEVSKLTPRTFHTENADETQLFSAMFLEYSDEPQADATEETTSQGKLGHRYVNVVL